MRTNAICINILTFHGNRIFLQQLEHQGRGRTVKLINTHFILYYIEI